MPSQSLSSFSRSLGYLAPYLLAERLERELPARSEKSAWPVPLTVHIDDFHNDRRARSGYGRSDYARQHCGPRLRFAGSRSHGAIAFVARRLGVGDCFGDDTIGPTAGAGRVLAMGAIADSSGAAVSQ